MIDLVPTGDLGLDVLLGGGWRLVTRLPERRSATVLVRGGAGAGKTLVGLQVALTLAEALGGDVAVGCVEILPTEYVAQVRSARPDLAEGRVVALRAGASPKAPASEPRVFCGLLAELDPSAPDLVASLEALGTGVEEAGGKPVVFVVDSLIEGYGIGASASRTSADAVMKFAAQRGCGVVLCEEALGDSPSPWVFAADTILELGVEPRERGRWIEVRKHRFGPSVSGRHEIDLSGSTCPAVFPDPHAWVARDPRGVLITHGWKFQSGYGTVPLVWHDLLRTTLAKSPTPVEPFRGAFALVTASRGGLARTLALGLVPESAKSSRDLIFELDPLALRENVWEEGNLLVRYLPTMHGPARALRGLVERFSPGDARRVLVGDLGLVLVGPDALAWVEAVRVFASLVLDSGCDVPVIAFAGCDDDGRTSTARSMAGILATHADVRIDGVSVASSAYADVTERTRRRQKRFHWPENPEEGPLAPELADNSLPRPWRRETDRRQPRG